MAEAAAWIVQLEGNLCVAVGEHEMVHFIHNPVFAALPHTPVHCQQLLLWEDEMLPVLDLTAWLSGRPADCRQAAAGIVRWPNPEAVLQYGALLCAGLPQKVRVNDAQACDLPTRPGGWQGVALSCFKHNGQPVPIIDVPYLFSGALSTRPC